MITDPPYNVDYGAKTEFLEAYLGQEGSRKNSTIENDHMDHRQFLQLPAGGIPELQ